jgi:hypothetical protein
LLFADGKQVKAPTLVSAKTIAFVSFDSGLQSDRLKQDAAQQFRKWKRYQLLSDPTQADLVVLLGAMPRKVSAEAFNAILDGKPSPVPVDLSNALPYFAVFDANELRNGSGTMKPLWSMEAGDGIGHSIKKFKEVVGQADDTYYHDRDLLSKCLAMGERCQR